MLILSRHKGQQIHIGDDIVITVNEIREDAVKLGIEAPREVSVLRHELYQQKKWEQKYRDKPNT